MPERPVGAQGEKFQPSTGTACNGRRSEKIGATSLKGDPVRPIVVGRGLAFSIQCSPRTQSTGLKIVADNKELYATI